jgi:hypothetical protein
MRRPSLSLLLLLLLAAGPALAKSDKPSPRVVHAAVQRAAAWLEARYPGPFESGTWHSVPELVVLTLHHAGVKRDDKTYAAGLKAITTCELQYTYRVSTMAMALSRINPYLYRARLAHCAQWLVDTQLPDGSWGYPGTIQGRSGHTRALKVDPPVTPEEAKGGPKAEPIRIVRKLDPKTLEGHAGDASNTQFALLGLRACGDARIQVPKETWAQALVWMAAHQQPDGSFGYDHAGERDEAGYASLTAASAVGAAICQHALGHSARSHPVVRKALAWLDKHWVGDHNAGIEDSVFIPPSTWHCYHLYAVERAGRVLGVKKLAKQDWYAEGAHWLLANQQPDGSWNDTRGDTTARRPPYLQTADTCFAVLFLTLSTPPLTGG